MINKNLNLENFKNFETTYCFAAETGKNNKTLIMITSFDNKCNATVSFRIKKNTKTIFSTNNLLEAIDSYNNI